MKRYLISLSILAMSAAITSRADDVIPKRTDFSRYTAMVEHSPFAVASAPVQASTTPSWSKDLFIANAAQMREADLITIMSLSDKNLKEYVSTEEPNGHGYAIASIEWSDNPGGTKVTISKDGQFATLGFNEAVMSQAPTIPGNVPPNTPAVVKPGAPQTMTMPTPHVRGVIQRKPTQPTPPPNAAPMSAPEQ